MGGGSGGFRRAGGEVQFEAQLFGGLASFGGMLKWFGPIDLAFALFLSENES